MKSKQKQEHGRAAGICVILCMIVGMAISRDRYPNHWTRGLPGGAVKHYFEEFGVIAIGGLTGYLVGISLVFLVTKIRRHL